MSDPLIVPPDYAPWLAGLKQRLHDARRRAKLAANAEQIALYHHIGGEIRDHQERQGCGVKVIDQLASDLREAFPEMKGSSPRNLKYMRLFAELWSHAQIGQQSAAHLPWSHVLSRDAEGGEA